jgi:iron complex transport system ATP-binding protein
MGSSNDIVLSLDSVCTMANGKSLLRNISFAVKNGELVSVIGPNGAGKSTLLKCISFESPPGQGIILLNNTPIEDYDPKDRARHMAVLPQANTLSFPYTVDEVIALGRTPHDTPRNTNGVIIRDILHELDLTMFTDRIYTTLSSGEKQRVQLARVMAQIWDVGGEATKLLIMDEPLTALDLKYQKELVQIFKKISARGMAIVTVIHDINIALAISDKILALKDGEIAYFDSPGQIEDARMFSNLFNIELEMITTQEHAVKLFF